MIPKESFPSRVLTLWVFTFIFICGAAGQPQELRRLPYTLRWSVDGWTLGVAATTAFAASAIDDNLPVLSLAEIQSVDARSINFLERFNAGWYSKDQDFLSDVLAGGMILSPMLFVFDDVLRDDVFTISTMYLETAIFATFVPSFAKGSVRRIRPYAYGSSAPLQEKMSVESLRSFFSGHATWAFASGVFFATVYSDYHPDSEYHSLVWGGSIGLASTVSFLRVTSGAHFVSDIVVGAAVGSAIGYLIPYLHRTEQRKVLIQPFLSPSMAGIRLSVNFHK